MKNSTISTSTTIAILIAILCIFSCSHHSAHWDTLRHADACMEEHPDSALAALQRIEAQELAGKEERAKYALLLSMALDKNYVDKTDFEVLQPHRLLPKSWHGYGQAAHLLLRRTYLSEPAEA